MCAAVAGCTRADLRSGCRDGVEIVRDRLIPAGQLAQLGEAAPASTNPPGGIRCRAPAASAARRAWAAGAGVRSRGPPRITIRGARCRASGVAGDGRLEVHDVSSPGRRDLVHVSEEL